MAVIFSFNLKEVIKPKAAGKNSADGGFSLKGTNGCTLVLIHGLTGTPTEVKFLATFFNKKGYSVICPLLANHGTPLRVLKHTKWQDFYGSVRDLFIKGELAHEKGPIFVSGLSMGALFSLLIADEFKDRIWGVSCLAPTLFYDGWNTPLSKYFLPLAYHTPLKYFFYLKEDPPYGIKNEAIRDRIHKYYCNAKLEDIDNVGQYGYPYFPITLLCQLQFLVKHLMRKLPRITVPVQLVQAKDDDMTSTRNSKVLYDSIGSAMKEIVLLYDSYHVITADQERDIVAEKMNNFFDNILKERRENCLKR